MDSRNSKSARTRNWATIVYPDSENTPANWLEVLGELCIPCLVSPLHDMDKNADGEFKKPHFHVLFLFDGVKSRQQVEILIRMIGGVGCEAVASSRGYARYLCHLDNPEKAQYNRQFVRAFAGVDYDDIISLPSDNLLILSEILDFCEDNDIVDFYRLIMYARYEKPDWYRLLTGGYTVFITNFLRSKEHSKFRDSEAV